jgi:hypothetical protein
MAGKASFTPDEWARIVASPMVASMAITAADPSGVWGLLKEAMAGGWALLDATNQPARQGHCRGRCHARDAQCGW